MLCAVIAVLKVELNTVLLEFIQGMPNTPRLIFKAVLSSCLVNG